MRVKSVVEPNFIIDLWNQLRVVQLPSLFYRRCMQSSFEIIALKSFLADEMTF